MENIEIWKDILDFEGLYQIGNLGRVKSLRGKEKILRPGVSGDGYLYVILCRKGKRTYGLVHRLVAIAFIPNPENKPEVNHIYGIKTDSRASELEWCTGSENKLHAYKNGLNPGNGQKKLIYNNS